MAFLTESTLRGPVLFKSRCTFSCVDTLCHNFELNFGFLDEFERKAPLGGRMRNWIICMPFQIVNFLGILKKFTGIIDDSMRVVQERVLNSKTCQKMNYNHRYSCIHVDGLGNHNLWCWMNDVRIFFKKMSTLNHTRKQASSDTT